uniref:Uncharacterized protein n=1 Tax=Anguilla anguilla TaxID=7936 RepID=A0A0E9TP09_ANGAN
MRLLITCAPPLTAATAGQSEEDEDDKEEEEPKATEVSSQPLQRSQQPPQPPRPRVHDLGLSPVTSGVPRHLISLHSKSRIIFMRREHSLCFISS